MRKSGIKSQCNNLFAFVLMWWSGINTAPFTGRCRYSVFFCLHSVCYFVAFFTVLMKPFRKRWFFLCLKISIKYRWPILEYFWWNVYDEVLSSCVFFITDNEFFQNWPLQLNHICDSLTLSRKLSIWYSKYHSPWKFVVC